MKGGLLIFLVLIGETCAQTQEPRPVPAASQNEGKPAIPAVAPLVEIIPHPGTLARPGMTLIWTAALQSAFDRVLGSKGPLPLEKVEPANPVIEAMGKFQWNEDSILPKDGWFAVAGPETPQLAAEATRKWRALAGPGEVPFEAISNADDAYAAFTGFKRDFAFKTDFFSSQEVRMEWGTERTPVKYFGVGASDAGLYSENVRVLVHSPEDNSQALQFLARGGDDTLVLYMPAGTMRMDDAIRLLNTAQKAWRTRREDPLGAADKRLHFLDTVRVPDVSLSQEEDLTGKFSGRLHFKDIEKSGRIDLVKTSMKLDVDAKGVMVKAKAEIQGRGFGGAPAPPKNIPRRFSFDRPFFLFIWRDGAEWPYAAVWFGNAEGLVK